MKTTAFTQLLLRMCCQVLFVRMGKNEYVGTHNPSLERQYEIEVQGQALRYTFLLLSSVRRFLPSCRLVRDVLKAENARNGSIIMMTKVNW